jgi:hypothetical protein
VVCPYTVPRPVNSILSDENGSYYSPTLQFLSDVIDGDLIKSELEASARSGNPFESRENVVKATLAPQGKVSGDRLEFCLDLLEFAKHYRIQRSNGDACPMILTSSAGILKEAGYTAFLKNLKDEELMDSILSTSNTISGGLFVKVMDDAVARISQAKAEVSEAKAEISDAKAEISKAKAETSKAKAETSKAKELTGTILKIIKTHGNPDDPVVKALIKAIEGGGIDAGGPGADGAVHASETEAKDDQP